MFASQKSTPDYRVLAVEKMKRRTHTEVVKTGLESFRMFAKGAERVVPF